MKNKFLMFLCVWMFWGSSNYAFAWPWSSTPFNVAVVGSKDSGKTSLIKRLCSRCTEHIEESDLTHPKWAKLPDGNKVQFYELPGDSKWLPEDIENVSKCAFALIPFDTSLNSRHTRFPAPDENIEPGLNTSDGNGQLVLPTLDENVCPVLMATNENGNTEEWWKKELRKWTEKVKKIQPHCNIIFVPHKIDLIEDENERYEFCCDSALFAVSCERESKYTDKIQDFQSMPTSSNLESDPKLDRSNKIFTYIVSRGDYTNKILKDNPPIKRESSKKKAVPITTHRKQRAH